jgi:hypothetical protein
MARKPSFGDAQAAILAELRTTNSLLMLLLIPTLRTTLEQTLGSDAERRAYELSDGSRGTREVATLAGASAGSVSAWWKKWRMAGAALEAPGERTRHVLPLSALGIAVPPRK